MEKMTSINPVMLTWCRETCGVSLKEASKKFGANRVEDWENGIDFPTYNQLQQLCDYYKKPVAVCFFPEPPEYKNLSTSFRTISDMIGSSIFNYQTISLVNEARVMQLNLTELNGRENVPYQIFRNYTFSTDTIKLAKQLREIFGVSIEKQKKIKKTSEHFELWRDKFASVGIFVFKDAFSNDDISGFCLYDDLYPIIYINNSLSFTRQLFTLFHEICHIIYQTSGIDMLNDHVLQTSLTGNNLKIERLCNAFAGAFLVPDDDFKKEIYNKQPTEDVVEHLATLYGVSREVILRKFLDFSLITSQEYAERSSIYTEDYYRVRDLSRAQQRSRGNYYNTQAAYKGSRYIELVFKNYYASKISLSQAANYMSMKIPSIRTFAEKRGWGII